jgi:hypothetical protein
MMLHASKMTLTLPFTFNRLEITAGSPSFEKELQLLR